MRFVVMWLLISHTPDEKKTDTMLNLTHTRPERTETLVFCIVHVQQIRNVIQIIHAAKYSYSGKSDFHSPLKLGLEGNVEIFG